MDKDEPTSANITPPTKLPSGISRHVLEGLVPYMEAAGVKLPALLEALVSHVPEVLITNTIRDLAETYGGYLGASGLYLSNDQLVTVDATTGKLEPMTAKRFVGWSESFVSAWAPDKNGEKKYQSISPQKAEVILAQDNFKSHVPVLAGVNVIKMPYVEHEPETGKMIGFRLLQEGYDSHTKILTLKGLDYDETMPFEDACKWLHDLFCHFPWGDGGRSYGVHLCYYLTVFCRCMLPPMSRSPMFYYNANSVGSGKSQLARLALWAVYGRAGLTMMNENQERFITMLDAVALANGPFLFFDDLTGRLENQALNAWMTGPLWDGRVLGTSRTFSAPLTGCTVITGNQLKLSDDLERRSLLIDLFAESTVRDRGALPDGATEITDEWSADPKVRAKLNSALYAIVRHGMVGGGVAAREKSLAGLTVKASFGAWSRVIVPLVAAVPGVEDPLAEPKLPDAGGTDEADRGLTLAKAVELYAGDRESFQCGIRELAAAARHCGAFIWTLGSVEDVARDLDQAGKWPLLEWPKTIVNAMMEEEIIEGFERRKPETEAERVLAAASYLSQSQSSSFGKRIRKRTGMKFKDAEGRAWQFGSREDARCSTFTLKLIK